MKRRLARNIAVLCLVLVAGGAFAYRVAYGTWWGTPDRIDYCGREYNRGLSDLTLAKVQGIWAASPGDAPHPLVKVAAIPPVVGQPVFVVRAPQSKEKRHGLPCAMAVYMKTGSDTYTAYALSGGP